jgi:hypothetical protein
MRRATILLAVIASLAAACSSGTAATPGSTTAATAAGATTRSSPTQAAQTPAAATQAATAPAATTGGAPGGEAVRVVLTGGPNAGTYTGGAETNCSNGLIGPQGWGVQYSTTDATAGQLSSLQMVVAAAGKESDPNATFSGTAFLMTVTIGPLVGENTQFEVSINVDTSRSTGTGSATVQDNGSTAVIHATGTTPDGVGIDATVNCSTVIRM